jgi:hypothetical protein
MSLVGRLYSVYKIVACTVRIRAGIIERDGYLVGFPK